MSSSNGWHRRSGDYGGDSTLVRAQEIEGLPNETVSLFNTARKRNMSDLKKSLAELYSRRKTGCGIGRSVSWSD